MYTHAAAQYRQTGVDSKVLDADPHQLIGLLLAGARERLRQVEALIDRGEIKRKAQVISEVSNIICGLSASLDHQRGGDLAANLQEVYDYCQKRLVEANLGNDTAKLREVEELLGEIHGAWMAMPGEFTGQGAA